jgi:hypothetical protein
MKNINRCFLSVLFLLNSACVYAGSIESDLRCFVEKSTQKTKLEMRIYTDEARNWTGGYVKYGKNRAPISIVFHSAKTLEINEGRPSSFETIWLEISPTEVSGKYTTISQGANVYSLEYLGRKSNKKYTFSETAERDEKSDACKW